MQILEEQGLYFKVRIESVEELWFLTQILSSEDIVYAQTKRKVALGEDKKKQVTKLISINLLISKLEFTSDILRISGSIQNETQFTAIGQHHSLQFGVGDVVCFEKKELLTIQKEYLERAKQSKSTKQLLLLVDNDELIAVEYGDAFFSVLFQKKGLGAKKYYSNQINENEVKFEVIKDLLDKKYNSIIIMGSPHTAKPFVEYIKTQSDVKPLFVQWSEISTSAVEKALAHLSREGIVESSHLAHERELVSEVLHRIEKHSKVEYGFEQTKHAISQGAIETLLLTTHFIEKSRDNGNFHEISDMMKTTEQLRGSIVIVNSSNTPGKELDGLGGVAALLRY